jgi:hypothetical protein
MPMKDLYVVTLALVRQDTRSIPDIAKGAEVNRHWLEKFKQERHTNPGVRTVQKLHDWLSSNPPPGKRARS